MSVDTTAAGGWTLDVVAGSAADLHAGSAGTVSAAPVVRRQVRLMEVERRALVLGSAQSRQDLDVVEAARRGYDIVSRRSGGGAVLVGPTVLWVDLVLPVDDPLWEPDVGRSSWWVGDLWAQALQSIGVGPTTVWKQAMKPSRWSSAVCFAGVAGGEILVGTQKVFGVSQRRTRYGALFQTATLLEWSPDDLTAILRLSDSGDPADGPGRQKVTAELGALAVGIGADRCGPLWDAVAALLMP